MSVNFGPRACDCNRNASVGPPPTIQVTHWGAFEVAAAMINGRPTVVLFYDGSSPQHPHAYSELSDVWRAANVKQRITGSFVIEVDLREHPDFFYDLQDSLSPGLRGRMPSSNTTLPFTLMAHKQEVTVVHHMDHLKGAKHYISIVDTFLRIPAPLKVQPIQYVEKTEVSAPMQEEEANETKWWSIKEFVSCVGTVHTDKVDDMVKHTGGKLDTVAILLTSPTCPACIRCHAEVWDSPDPLVELPPNVYVIRVGIEDTTEHDLIEKLSKVSLEYYPALVVMKVIGDRVGIRVKVGYNNRKLYMEKVNNMVDFSRAYVNN